MMSSVLCNAVAVGATAFAAWFSVMDASPSLYVYDKLLINEERLGEAFRGKNVWIVGASSGIGAETSRVLSRYGANLILSSRSSERLDAVAENLRCASPTGRNGISVVPLDVTGPPKELKEAIEKVLKIIGKGNLDYLILSSGSGQLAPARDTEPQTTEELFKINTLAPIALTQQLLKRGILDEAAGKHVVVASSVGAKFGVPLSSSYASCKHALHGYYNSLQAECPWLRVDLICPGPVDTPFHKRQLARSNPLDKQAKPETVQSGKSKPSVRELKMSVERCAKLLVSSLLMPKGNERWIAEHPTLLALYVNQLFPGLFQKILQRIGPMRVQAWKEGKNLYDPKTWQKVGKSGKNQ